MDVNNIESSDRRQLSHQIQRILDIPRVEFGDLKQNSLKIPVGLKGIVWDEFDGKLEQLNPYYLKFSYTLNDGLYKCSAELE